MTANKQQLWNPFLGKGIGKHVPAATNTRVTIGLLLETVFSTRYVRRGYKEDNWGTQRGPPDSWPHFTASYSRLPQTGGPGSRIYIPRNRVAQLYPQVLGSPFRRLLRLAGLRWKYSNLRPHGFNWVKSKIFCEWRFTANQFVLASSPLRPTTRDFFNWILAVIVLM
jgi:hypothetical protein